MNEQGKASRVKDKPLFTPGHLTTRMTVKQAMLRDIGSRDYEFIKLVKRVCSGLLAAVFRNTLKEIKVEM